MEEFVIVSHVETNPVDTTTRTGVLLIAASPNGDLHESKASVV